MSQKTSRFGFDESAESRKLRADFIYLKAWELKSSGFFSFSFKSILDSIESSLTWLATNQLSEFHHYSASKSTIFWL